MSIEDRLSELGLELPPSPKAVAIYRPSLVVGSLCYTSGHLPLNLDGSLHCGCLAKESDVEAGYAAAKQAGLGDPLDAEGGVGLFGSSYADRKAVGDGQFDSRIHAATSGYQWL